MLLSHKKKEILPFVIVWTALESIMLSELSQVVKDKYMIIPVGELYRSPLSIMDEE